MFDNNFEGKTRPTLKSGTITLKSNHESHSLYAKKTSNPSNTATSSKKINFENFLTHRKRFSRLAISQGLYFLEYLPDTVERILNKDEEVNEVYRVIIYFYKKMFFGSRYGNNKKNKRLEETFIRSTIKSYIYNKEQVDALISKHLKSNWKLQTLNNTLRSNLRSAVCEALFYKKPNFKIIASEYTSLVSNSSSNEKEVDFFNAVLDSILKEISTL